MCNTWANYTNGCYNANTQTTVGNPCIQARCGCGNEQRMCRDACGNIWVRRNLGCGGCGCQGGNVLQTTNAYNTRGGYLCLPMGVATWGVNGVQTTQEPQGVQPINDIYYARQYGLYPCGRRTCGCGGFLAND